eukprot:TRINITY_DN9460_c0_g1_i1.p1 TRINITY_DN9460_c0_g1~~TRINITY_DN9460_c0_g1_i1.p1  ORF type:complete len:168 (+),score=39.06 TRINITY_DN9460_c0_g1_i1:162-665(+)
MVPMDGFHYYRRELNEMENPTEAHRKRGAHWTFNAKALYNLLYKIKTEGEAKAPSFDHKVGDPVEEAIEIKKSHQIVVVEGNYLFLEEGVWQDINKLFDERWFIDCNIDEAMERVVLRHLQTGLTEEAARFRVLDNDKPNGLLIIEKGSKSAERIIKSKNDNKLKAN